MFRLNRIKASTVYSFSLFLVMISLLLSFASVYRIMKEQSQFAELINISGKQRMLSQKVFADSLLAGVSPSSLQNDRIDTSVQEMEHNFQLIQKYFGSSNFYKINKQDILRMSHAVRIVAVNPSADSLEKAVSTRDSILSHLDEVVTRLEQRSDVLSDKMIRHAAFLLAVQIILLGMLNLFVFRPMNREIQKNQATLQHLATTDELTGLRNRRYFEESLDQHIARLARNDRPFAIAMLDLDHFKQINGRFGHSVGDYALEEFGKLLTNNLRTVDIKARWGGEEFIVLLSGVKPHNAIVVMTKLITQIRNQSFSHFGQLTCSIGLTYVQAEDSIRDLTNRVDKLLYAAKQEGRNRIVTDIQVSSVEPTARKQHSCSAKIPAVN